jgi:MFS family permease
MIHEPRELDPTKHAIPRTVVVLGVVSLLTDLSSEMIYPLLPVFLTVTLGAGAVAVGVIEGIAETTAALLKVVSGAWTDRVARRKPFILWGYGLAGIARPLIGLATGWPFVLFCRFLDRAGKGIRTSPRDALIADVTPLTSRGRAFGYHRMMDHVGAVIGPLVAAGLLSYAGFSLQTVFLCAGIPALAVVVVIALGVREPQTATDNSEIKGVQFCQGRGLSSDFRSLLLAVTVFTLGNSTDAFLILRLSDAGIDASWIAVIWAAQHVVKSGSTYLGGVLSDRWGPRRAVRAGWLVYVAVYLAFAFGNSPSFLVAVFLAYGLYFGLAEPAERAWVAALVPANLRGTGMGLYHGAVGLAALPASVLFGLLWQSLGAPVAFCFGAALAAGATILLGRVREFRTE